MSFMIDALRITFEELGALIKRCFDDVLLRLRISYRDEGIPESERACLIHTDSDSDSDAPPRDVQAVTKPRSIIKSGASSTRSYAISARKATAIPKQSESCPGTISANTKPANIPIVKQVRFDLPRTHRSLPAWSSAEERRHKRYAQEWESNQVPPEFPSLADARRAW